MRIAYRVIVGITLLSMSLACAPRTEPPINPPAKDTPAASKIEFKLTSNAFKEGEAIPRQYTCDGVNVSPSLEWSGVPRTAKTIAIIADDPDAPSGTWAHWVLYNLPAEIIGLVENLAATENLRAGGFQGKNDFGNIGYGGPCPPTGSHRYFFKIYAVDSELPLKAGATKAEVERALEGHIVAQTQLMGMYGR